MKLDNDQIPQTMTQAGLSFLEALARRKTRGVYLEIGPLFGSSTNAIDKGRAGPDEIHTIDTFAPAEWIKRRFDLDFSLSLFQQYTNHIENLVVHQGFAPDIVKDCWEKDIGFYFDDATHGDPGWSNNFNFFQEYFNSETIICGDDFAGGWPNIVQNVVNYSEKNQLELYVIGRVWALTKERPVRIREAIDEVYPELANTTITVSHAGQERERKAASWSPGLHLKTPMDHFAIVSPKEIGEIIADGNEPTNVQTPANGLKVDLQGVKSLRIKLRDKLKIQFCLVRSNKRTENTAAYKHGQTFYLPEDARIVAVRLTT